MQLAVFHRFQRHRINRFPYRRVFARRFLRSLSSTTAHEALLGRPSFFPFALFSNCQLYRTLDHLLYDHLQQRRRPTVQDEMVTAWRWIAQFYALRNLWWFFSIKEEEKSGASLRVEVYQPGARRDYPNFSICGVIFSFSLLGLDFNEKKTEKNF